MNDVEPNREMPDPDAEVRPGDVVMYPDSRLYPAYFVVQEVGRTQTLEGRRVFLMVKGVRDIGGHGEGFFVWGGDMRRANQQEHDAALRDCEHWKEFNARLAERD